MVLPFLLLYTHLLHHPLWTHINHKLWNSTLPGTENCRNIGLGLFDHSCPFSAKWALLVGQRVHLIWNINRNMGLVIILSGQRTFYKQCTGDIGMMVFLAIFALLESNRALPLVWTLIHRNSYFSVHSRGQPTVYDEWFRRYWIGRFWLFPALFGPKWELPVGRRVHFLWS